MKKKGNKKMALLRHKLIDNPIPISLFISDMLVVALLFVDTTEEVRHGQKVN